MNDIMKFNKRDLETKETEKDTDYPVSQYARVLDEDDLIWCRGDATHVLLYLKAIQNYCNDVLRHDKRLLLNDVYSMLGLTDTEAGQIVGWIYAENNPIGDNFVDFGIYNEINVDFINGKKLKVILDFNVDGDIRKYL